MLSKIKLGIGNVTTITLHTNMESILEKINTNITSLTKTIPVNKVQVCGAEDTINTEQDNQIFLINSNHKKINLDAEKNITYVFSPEEEMRFPDLVYILLGMYSNDLLKKRKYLLHSSALKYDENKSILLIGDANAGKTSLAYKLMEDYGCQLIANDHVLLGIENDLLTTYHGTKEVEMRMGIIKSKFPYLLDKIKQPYIEKEQWKKKVIVNDCIDDYKIARDDKTSVTDVFQICVNSGGETFVEPKDSVDQLLYLYEQLSKPIKGTYNLITGFDYPLPSFENPEGMNNLSKDIRTTLKNTTVHSAKGTLEELSKRLVLNYGRK